MAQLIDSLFLSVGAMKAGTTWMFRCLSRHPEIYFSPEKEIHYFAHRYVDDEQPLSDTRRLDRARAHARVVPDKQNIPNVRLRMRWLGNYLADPIDDLWYRNLFLFRNREPWCADFSNLYALVEKPGWDHIRAGVDRLRVIYTMRDPVERLWSHAKFHLQFSGSNENIDDWDAKRGEAFVRAPHIWKHAQYDAVIERLASSLPEEERRFYFFEPIHDDPRQWLREIESYLGISHFDYPAGVVDTKINVTEPKPVPPWFSDLLRPDVERQVKALRKLGLKPPASWLEPAKSA